MAQNEFLMPMTQTIPHGKHLIPQPTSIQLYPTNRCNANCLFCWRHNNTQDLVELPDERWLELADEICALDIPKVTICGGGEPLLRTQLVLQMMEKFSQAGIDSGLITNGMLITEQLAKRVVELQWQSVQVSIHAPTAQANDILMGKEGAFNLASRGIENLNRCKRLLKSALPELSMRIVITQSNVSVLPEFVQLAHSKGASRVFVNMENQAEMTTRGGGLCTLTRENLLRFRSAIKRAGALAKQTGVILDFEFDIEQLFHSGHEPHSTRPRPPCHLDGASHKYEPAGKREESAAAEGKQPHCPIPFTELVLFANGMASPCCNYFNLQFKGPEEQDGWLEDVTPQSLDTVWRKGFSNLRESMFTKGALCSTCKTCSMNLRHQRSQWPQSFWDQRFGHFRKKENYQSGIRFGLEQLGDRGADAFLHSAIGEFNMEVRDFESAIQHLSAAIGCHDCPEEDKDSLHLKLGRCHLEREEYGKALGHFQNILKPTSLRKNRISACYFMASCYRRLRQYNKMKECLRKVKKLNEQGHRPVEQKNADELSEQWPTRFFHEEFGHLKKCGEYREGISFGTEQLKGHPDSAVLHHYLGEFHMELEEYPKAIFHLSEAVKLEPKREWTHFSLGKCYYLINKYGEAESALNKNLALTSDRLSHYHSWLFLAMIADATNDRSACLNALNSLKRFQEFVGQEIPLEREFLKGLRARAGLPRWL